MYQCLICMDVIEIPGFCFCGRLHVDSKQHASGEAFIKLRNPTDGTMNNSTRIDVCPHCKWKGLIVPKLNMGCPDHGEWWYKKDEAVTVKMDDTKKENTGESEAVVRDKNRRDNRRLKRASGKVLCKHDENGKTVPKPKYKRQAHKRVGKAVGLRSR